MHYILKFFIVYASLSSSKSLGHNGPELSTGAKSSLSNSIDTSTRHGKHVLELLCGLQKRGYGHQAHDLRVIGGQQALSNTQWPWMAVLFRTSSFGSPMQRCGAFLISELHVITAAHCVNHLEITEIKLLIGSDDVEDTRFALRNISSLKVHENYSYSDKTNDIALIRLSEPVEFAANVLPICLPQNLDQLANLTATVMGWGKVNETDLTSRHLKYTNMTILSNERCVEEFEKGGRTETIGHEFLCARHGAGNETDACIGDSGGPLVVKDGDQFAVVGIVSWGVGCANAPFPGVYTNITTYLHWIRANL
ncbi:Serine proteinase stubble [Halotydeus destructor]|nr:Serine proteinase stubble [Halotydeus destructor]